MSDAVDFRYNLVILPTRGAGPAAETFQFSAGSPGRPRMISPADWTAAEARAALAAAGLTAWEADQLFRGNRMVAGGRSTVRRFFTSVELTRMGLVDEVVVPLLV